MRLLKYWPLTSLGRARLMASVRAARFSTSWTGSKSDLPKGTWMMPPLSTLNSMRPPNPPHFGRLELNRELSDRGLLPQDIERTVLLGGLFRKPERARSHHVVGTAISGTDRRRIDEAGGYLVSFAKVTLADYVQLATVASR